MCTCGSTDTTSSTETKRVGSTFKVDDMTCAHCAGTIRNALKDGLPGVDFTVDIESQTVTVAGDAARAEAIIRDAGYEPELLVH